MPKTGKKIIKSLIAAIPYVGPIVAQYFSQLSSEEVMRALKEIKELREPDIEELANQKQIEREQIRQMLKSIEDCLIEISTGLQKGSGDGQGKPLINNNIKVARYREYLENFLRRFISEKMEESYGADWWQRKVPLDVQRNASERKRYYVERSMASDAEPLINFADFLSLKEMLFFEGNWQIFGEYYGTRKEQRYVVENKFFPELCRIRNSEAHSRGISDVDLKKFEVYALELLCFEEQKNQFKELIELWETPLKQKEFFLENINSRLARNAKFPRKEDFDNKLVYSDETTKKTVVDMLITKRICLIHGPPACRKTTFSFSLGRDLSEKGQSVYYFEVKENEDVDFDGLFREAILKDSIENLIIIDDCHKSPKEIYEFIYQVKMRSRNARFLFASRSISSLESEHNYFEALKENSVRLLPLQEVWKGIIDQYCEYRNLTDYDKKIGDIGKIIANCGSNVLLLNLLLKTWYEANCEGVLSDFTKEKFYQEIAKQYRLREDRDLLKLCAIYQFEIPISIDFAITEKIPDSSITKWLNEGLVLESTHSPYYTMTHPYFARVLLRAGEARRFLVLEPSQASKDLREYSICILERYVEVERRELQKVLSGVYRDEELGVRDGFIQRASVFSSIKRFFVEESDFTLVSSLLFFVLHRDITKEMKTELISNLNLGKIADSIKKTESKRLQTLTNFLRDIQERRDEMMKKLDFVGIADIAMITKAEHLDELRNFLNVLGEHKERFIDEVIASEGVLKKIANVASSIPHNRFHDLANVFDVFGSRKSHLIDLLDIDSLIRTAGQAATEDIRGITLFMSSLDEKTRQRFIREVDWVSLCLMCPIEPGLLRALGGCLENLINQAGMVGDRSRCEKVIHHLENHEDDFVHAIRNAYEQVMNYPYDYAPLYSGVSKFVHNSSKLDNEYAKELVEQTNSKLVECFRIVPRAYYYVGQLLDCFYYIDPSLSYFLLTNKKVRGRIQQSINENDPCKEIRGLRRLIAAFYLSVPSLWRKMIDYGWITKDLRPLDLESIYRDVDEKRGVTPI